MFANWIVLILIVYLLNGSEAATKCEDKIKTCEKVTDLCKEQGKKGDLVRQNCQMTCKLCRNKSDQCTDYPSCAAWARNGFCKTKIFSKKKKEELCPRACQAPCAKQAKTTTESPDQKKTTTQSPETTTEHKYPVFANSMNERVNPCTDFYKFTCGKYIANHKPKQPSDNFATFNDLGDRVTEQQTALLLANGSTPSTAVKKMRVFRERCMNTSELDRLRTEQLRKDLTIIGKCPIFDATWKESDFDLTKTLIEMIRLTGDNFLFDSEATWADDNGEMTTIFSPADTIIKNISMYSDEKLADKMQALHDFLADIMVLISLDAKSTKTFAQIEKAVTELIKMEKNIANIMKKNGYQDQELLTKPPAMDKKKFKDLGTIISAIEWAKLFQADPRMSKEIHNYYSKNPNIRVYTVKMMKALNAFYISNSTSKETLANYLCVQFVIKQLPYLDSRFAAAGNRFAEKIDGSPHKSTRTQDCKDAIETHFGLVSDYLYVKKYLPSATVKAMSNMIEDLRSGLSDVFKEKRWMSKTTKANAQKKIKHTKKIIGAVEDARNPAKLDKRYEGIKFEKDDNFQQMATKIKMYTARESLKKLVNPKLATDSESMRATEVNAMHIYEENLIFMSAAMLQSPFFDIRQPAAVQYGGIGFIVGHEFTHGFDTGGADYDENGKKKDWWDAQTKKEFDKRSKCFVDLYSKQIEPHVKKHVDGNLTIPENVADNGGIRAAFRAYKKHLKGRRERHVSGYRKYNNEQTFFIAYGTSFCSSLGKEQIETRLLTDPHSPTEFRVNVVLSNYPEFSKAFKCKKGTKMNPKRQCAVW